MFKNIGIIGVGGVGGYFGGKLCRAQMEGQNIFFLARGAHLEAIRENGLTVKTVGEGEFTCHPTLATDNPAELPKLDFCLITVKGFDLSGTLSALKDGVTNKTVFLPLLNGIDIDVQIRAMYPGATVLPGCVYISSHIERPGVVVQTGGPCKIIFGNDPHHPETPPDEVIRLFETTGIHHEWVEDPMAKVWEKFLFIAPASLVTACYDKTLGEVFASPELADTVRDIMEEIIRLAEKKGLHFSGEIIGNILEKAKSFPSDTRTSFQNDFAKPDKQDEREIFGGSVLHLCEQEGIDCPTTQKIYRRLNEIKPLIR